jgi:hypothetical protein
MEIVNKVFDVNNKKCKSCNNNARFTISVLNKQNQLFNISYCTEYCSINDILLYDLLMMDFLLKMFYIKNN